jgi:hypothetical protein
VEWLKVYPLSSNPGTAIKKKLSHKGEEGKAELYLNQWNPTVKRWAPE